MMSGQPIPQNNSIQIQTFSTSMVVGGGTVVVYNSVLMAREMANGSYSRLCRADITYHDLMSLENVTTYPEVATANKIIKVRGELFLGAECSNKLMTFFFDEHIFFFLGSISPAPIEQFGVYGVSFELAIIEWTVSRITYTPETYQVVYRQVGDSEELIYSEEVIGTTNLSATNTQYSVVITNLQPNSMYTYNISARNVGVTRSTQNTSFSAIDSGEFSMYFGFLQWGYSIRYLGHKELICTGFNIYHDIQAIFGWLEAVLSTQCS